MSRFFSVSVTDESKAVCDECGKRVARGGRSAKSYTTTNLRNHLKRRHFSQYTELLKLEKTKSATDDDGSRRSPSPCHSSQSTIDRCFQQSKPYNKGHPEARKITLLIGEMMALDFQPFSIVEDTGFTALINHLDPRYKVPSRKYFSTTLIPEMYDQAKEKVKKTISQQSHIALTTDIWSSRAHDSFISFTAHLITEQFECKECLLQASKFNERHRGEYWDHD